LCNSIGSSVDCMELASTGDEWSANVKEN
jgi:hypothetical protein